MLYLRIVTNRKGQDDEEPSPEDYRNHVPRIGGTPILKPGSYRPPTRPRADIRRPPNKPRYLPFYIEDDEPDDPEETDA